MNAHQFLETLSARGVRLVPDASAPSGVKAIAPPGVVTGTVAERIRAAIRPLVLDGGSAPSLDAWVASGRPGSVSLARAGAEADEAISEQEAAFHWAQVLSSDLSALSDLSEANRRQTFVKRISRYHESIFALCNKVVWSGIYGTGIGRRRSSLVCLIS